MVNGHAQHYACHQITTLVPRTRNAAVYHLQGPHKHYQHTIGQHHSRLRCHYLQRVQHALQSGTEHPFIVHTGSQLMPGGEHRQYEKPHEQRRAAIGVAQEHEGQHHQRHYHCQLQYLQLAVEAPHATHAVPEKRLQHPWQKQKPTIARGHCGCSVHLQEHKHSDISDDGRRNLLCGKHRCYPLAPCSLSLLHYEGQSYEKTSGNANFIYNLRVTRYTLQFYICRVLNGVDNG